MKYKDFIIHVCLFFAFVFQLVFVIEDLAAYGFLSMHRIYFSDILIILRLLVFVPLCVYEGYLSVKYKLESDCEDENSSHTHHSHGKHRRGSHSSRRAHTADSNSNRMDKEYSRRTQFMDKTELLKKKEEMRKKESLTQ